MPGRERTALPQVHHPLASRDPAGHLSRTGDGRRGQPGRGRPGRVGRAHVRVVRRMSVQAGQQFGDVFVLGEPQYRVGQLLLADRGSGARRLGGRAEAAEAMRGADRCLIRQPGGQPPGGGVLRGSQGGCVSRAEQVRPPGRAVQQRPAGEHRGRLPGAGVLQHVGQVGERVPRGGDDLYGHRPADRDRVAVGDGDPVEADLIGGVHVIRRAGRSGQGQPAAYVVVVDVRLEHVGDPDPPRGRRSEDPVDVPLRVHHQGHPAIGGQVAAVPQRWGVDADDVDHRRPPAGARTPVFLIMPISSGF